MNTITVTATRTVTVGHYTRTAEGIFYTPVAGETGHEHFSGERIFQVDTEPIKIDPTRQGTRDAAYAMMQGFFYGGSNAAQLAPVAVWIMEARGRNYVRSIDDIKRANERAGYRFFDADTMRGFGSRVSENVYRGKDGTTLFCISNKDFRGNREYKVCRSMPQGNIEYIGDSDEFPAGYTFSTLAKAQAHALQVSKEETGK